MNAPTTKQKRGLALSTPEQRKVIASMGGKAAHLSGRAHEFTSEEAREAGRKGGLARAANKRARLAAIVDSAKGVL